MQKNRESLITGFATIPGNGVNNPECHIILWFCHRKYLDCVRQIIKNQMNCRIKSIFWVFIFPVLFFSSEIRANHILGADITWKYISADTVMVTASVYRSCAGIVLSNTPFKYFGDCSGFNSPKTVTGSQCCTKDITPSAIACNPCKSSNCPNGFGEQLILEQVKIGFPKGCCHWFVSWQQSSRDGAITTGPAGQNFYVEAELNTCLAKPDNGPVFITVPQHFYCTGICIGLGNLAKDPDSGSGGIPDSLVYTLTAPLQDHNKPVIFNKGYGYNAPLVCANDSPCTGFAFNNANGDIRCNVTKNDVSVVAIRVEKYRKDSTGKFVLIGSVMRDMELLPAADCPYKALNNQAPVLTGIDGGSTTAKVICSAQTICFNIRCFDKDPLDSVQLSWDSAIAGSSFTIHNKDKKWPSGTFCWTPKQNQARTKPYTFTVYARDKHKPKPGITSKTFTIRVSPDVSANYTVKETACGVYKFSATPGDSSVINSYMWTGEGAPGYAPLFSRNSTFVYTYTRPGTYHFTLSVTDSLGCITSYFDSVQYSWPNAIMPSDTVVCQKSPGIVISPKYAGGTPPYKYLWNTGSTSRQISAVISRDTEFIVTVTDALGCTGDDTKIKVHYRKTGIQGPAQKIVGCWGHAILLQATANGQINWTKIQNHKIVATFKGSDHILAIDSGIYIASIPDTALCGGSDSFRVFMNPPVKISPIDTTVCRGDSITLRPTIFPLNAYIKWTDLIHQTVVGYGPTYTFKAINNFNGHQFLMTYSVTTNGTTCTDSAHAIVKVHVPQVPKMTPVPPQCIHNPPVYLGLGYSYSRNPSAIVNGILYPSVMGPTDKTKGTGMVTYTLKDKYGCTARDSEFVLITDTPQVSAGTDTTLIKGCGKYILNNSQVNPHIGGVWTADSNTSPTCIQYSGDTVFFNPSFIKNDQICRLRYSYIDPAGTGVCDAFDSLKIRVLGRPIISIAALDTLCNDNNPIQLTGTPGGGVWQFADSTNENAIQTNGAPLLFTSLAGTGWHKIQYKLKNAGNCPDSVSSDFYVMPAPQIDFSTIDSQWAYCDRHKDIELITRTTGGSFNGSSVFMSGTHGYFKLSTADTVNSTNNMIRYVLYYNHGKCFTSVSHYITIILRPVISFLTDTLICGNNKIFHLRARIQNTKDVQWKSIDSGQDGGIFVNQVHSDSIAEADYIPGPEQLKQQFFTIYLTGFGNGICDTVNKHITVHIKPNPVADFVSNREGCEPLTVKFKNNSVDTAGTITRYEWDFGDNGFSLLMNPAHIYNSINADSLSFYDVRLKVYSNDGCSKTITKPGWIIVHAQPRPVIKAIPTFTTLERPTIHFGLSDQSRNCDTTDSSAKYDWHFGDRNNPDQGGHSSLKNPQYSYSDTGHYTVVLKITNASGCEGSDSEINLVDIRPAFAIFIPNVFLPGTIKGGGTHINKIFKPVLSSYSRFSMTIYNRWGELLFSTTDADTGWDGTYKGNTIPEGVYIYNIKACNLWGQWYQYTGNLTVIR
jgi:gliding motility-associated-like protein